MVDQPEPGDYSAAPGFYLDKQLTPLAADGQVEWHPYFEKFWIRHPWLP